MSLKDVICQDIRYLETHFRVPLRMAFCEYDHSASSQLYGLEADGREILLGTLNEINAAVKAMIRCNEIAAFLPF